MWGFSEMESRRLVSEVRLDVDVVVVSASEEDGLACDDVELPAAAA